MEEKVINKDKMQEALKLRAEMLEQLEKIAKERQAKALKRKITTDLEDIAISCTRDELKFILDTLGLKYKSADKKDTLISNLKENYKSSMIKLFENINSDIYDDLKIVLENNGILNMKVEEDFKSNSYLEIIGVLFLASDEEKNIYVVAPKEALEAIEAIDNKRVVENDKIISLFKGMTYYYGTLSVDEFKENLPMDAEVKVESLDIHKILTVAEEMSEEGFYIDSIGESDFLEDPSSLEELIEKEGLKEASYKELKAKELLAASEKRYIGESNIYKPLTKMLKENYDIPKNIINKLLEQIYMYSQSHSEDELINFMLSEINPPKYIEMKFREVLNKVYNRIPLWKYKGFSMVELLNAEAKETVKVGRNDKCPCGSGKKYKKCCGKN